MSELSSHALSKNYLKYFSLIANGKLREQNFCKEKQAKQSKVCKCAMLTGDCLKCPELQEYVSTIDKEDCDRVDLTNGKNI